MLAAQAETATSLATSLYAFCVVTTDGENSKASACDLVLEGLLIMVADVSSIMLPKAWF